MPESLSDVRIQYAGDFTVRAGWILPTRQLDDYELVKEYEWCRDEAKHPLMAQFQDYDWADEIVHANLGRANLPS